MLLLYWWWFLLLHRRVRERVISRQETLTDQDQGCPPCPALDFALDLFIFLFFGIRFIYLGL
jgi:hypothetical protein